MQSTRADLHGESQVGIWVLAVVVKMLGFIMWDLHYTPLIYVPVLVIGIVITIVGIHQLHHA